MGAPSTLEVLRRARDYSLAPAPRGAPWRDIPEDALPFSKRGSIASPAVATETEVVSYEVPRGFLAVLSHIFNRFDGDGYTNGALQVSWKIDINVDPLGGSMLTGRYVTDYGHIITNLGSFDSGPWPLDNGERFADGDVLRYKVTVADAALAEQAGAFVHCMLIGWIWPGERLNRDS